MASVVHYAVDGKQRLTTLHSFYKGKVPSGKEFRLQNLKLLDELNGLTYTDLPHNFKKSFDHYSLTTTTFKLATSMEAVLRVYEDLNCGAEALNKQQVGLQS